MSLRRIVPLAVLLIVTSWLAERAWRARVGERRREAERRAERGRLACERRKILASAENERPAALERLLARLNRSDDLRPSDVVEIARLLVEASDLVETGGYWYQDAVAEAEEAHDRAEEAHDRAEAEHEQKEDWFSEAARLEREVGSLQRMLAAKEDELQRVQWNWRETQRHTWPEDGRRPTPGTHRESEEPSPATVAEAVFLAKSNCPSLHFLAEADDSAATSPYIHPDRVYAAFRALDELAEARAVGPIGMSVRDWFKQRGIDYAAHESGTTMDKWGDERTYRYGGARWQMQEHIKVRRRTGSAPSPPHPPRLARRRVALADRSCRPPPHEHEDLLTHLVANDEGGANMAALEERWLDYAWSVVNCPPGHRANCEALGAAVPGAGRVDGNEVRWPGYLGRDYREGAGVLCVAAVHREARPEEEAGTPVGATNAQLVAAHRRWLSKGRSGEEDALFLESVRSAYVDALPHWPRWTRHFRTLVQDHLGLKRTEIAWTNLAKCRLAIHRGNRNAETDLTRLCQGEFAVADLVEAIRPALVLVAVLYATSGGGIVSTWSSPSASPLVYSWHGQSGHDRHNRHPERRKLSEWAPEMVAAYQSRVP